VNLDNSLSLRPGEVIVSCACASGDLRAVRTNRRAATTARIEGTTSIATGGCSQGNAPSSKTCSMRCRTIRMAARENRATHSTSDSTLAGANRSEGT